MSVAQFEEPEDRSGTHASDISSLCLSTCEAYTSNIFLPVHMSLGPRLFHALVTARSGGEFTSDCIGVLQAFKAERRFRQRSRVRVNRLRPRFKTSRREYPRKTHRDGVSSWRYVRVVQRARSVRRARGKSGNEGDARTR